MNPHPAKKVSVDLSGNAPMSVSAATAAAMFVAAREALEANGFNTARLDRAEVRRMEREESEPPSMTARPLANVTAQEARRAQRLGVSYV